MLRGLYTQHTEGTRVGALQGAAQSHSVQGASQLDPTDGKRQRQEGRKERQGEQVLNGGAYAARE